MRGDRDAPNGAQGTKRVMLFASRRNCQKNDIPTTSSASAEPGAAAPAAFGPDSLGTSGTAAIPTPPRKPAPPPLPKPPPKP